ncbi:hypothetical protein, partial [Lysinibacillus sp. D4A1_S13]|uniref:hypothetical protein n=1 Tax=Lysinibacillus sp. D4A1_S13 TaxID=2941228 RepID=UPI0020BE664A
GSVLFQACLKPIAKKIQPAEHSEENLTVSRIFSVGKWRRPAVISAFDFFMSLFYTKIDWFS